MMRITRINPWIECMNKLNISFTTKDPVVAVAAAAFEQLKSQEVLAKDRATRYYDMLQLAEGKVSILKNENNALRRQNARLLKMMK